MSLISILANIAHPDKLSFFMASNLTGIILSPIRINWLPSHFALLCTAKNMIKVKISPLSHLYYVIIFIRAKELHYINMYVLTTFTFMINL